MNLSGDENCTAWLRVRECSYSLLLITKSPPGKGSEIRAGITAVHGALREGEDDKPPTTRQAHTFCGWWLSRLLISFYGVATRYKRIDFLAFSEYFLSIVASQPIPEDTLSSKLTKHYVWKAVQWDNKGRDPRFHKKYREAGVVAFVALYVSHLLCSAAGTPTEMILDKKDQWTQLTDLCYERLNFFN